MKHPEIDENQVVEHYVAGKLSADDEARFEEHYLTCPACVRALRDAERLHRGLTEVAAEDAAARRTFVAVVAGLWRSRTGVLLATVLVAAVLLPSGLAWQHSGRLVTELDTARRELDEARLELDETRRNLEDERRPRINTPILTLTPTRVDEPPLHQVSLAPEPEWIVLAVELGEGLEESYTALLRSAEGAVVWQSPGLVPSYRGTLTMSLHSSLLPPGRYVLSLRGESRSGEPQQLSFPLDVVAAAP